MKLSKKQRNLLERIIGNYLEDHYGKRNLEFGGTEEDPDALSVWRNGDWIGSYFVTETKVIVNSDDSKFKRVVEEAVREFTR